MEEECTHCIGGLNVTIVELLTIRAIGCMRLPADLVYMPSGS
jgi:hypothetical protein